MPEIDLRRIRTFDQLLRFLEDELDWPIPEMEIDEIEDLAFFDWDAEFDLGLDPQTAAKVKSIKQLRPLSASQPFGIFFIEFEPKRLPVTAMRRILGKLVTRKRESANPGDRRTWDQHDLLFVSAYGDDETRRIDFAHFADDHKNGLPTLRVLGWDADDTDRKTDLIESRLRSHLTWPDDETPDEWRIRWRDAFFLRHREVVDTSKKLAHHLATLAQKIRARVLASIAVETDKGHLRKLHRAFQDSLISDLSVGGFADMYAQTISYGLLSAAIGRTVPGEGTALTLDDPGQLATNMSPFLRELMQEFTRASGRHSARGDGSGIDFDELGVNEVTELLREANMEAVVADFGRERPGEDPVIHFYEYFMEVYDKKEKVKRGVFYTPRPVVSFIVRSVDEILREEFGLPLGLADTTTWGEIAAKNADLKIPQRVSPEDPFVQILDPATGTGTFLVEVINLIAARMKEHWAGELGLKAPGDAEARANWNDPKIDELWNQYVPEHLLPRLYGFELMMAPYAIAHMKIGLKLRDTGYRFGSEQRLRVFLTNSLEPPTDLSEMLEFVAPFLAHEARVADAAKRLLRLTVLIGNPPYSNYGTTNQNNWIDQLLDEYKRGLNEKKLNLDDDFIKFMRFGHHMIDLTGVGVLGYITNHTYLDGITHRRMRHSLLETFTSLTAVDLHGSVKKAEKCPDGSPDENVFDIQQGVAITFAVQRTGRETCVQHAHVWGTREAKYRSLSAHSRRSMGLTPLAPCEPRYYFVPEVRMGCEEYQDFVAITDLFEEYATGFETARDHFAIGFTSDDIRSRIEGLLSVDTTEAVRAEWHLDDKRDWQLVDARNRLKRLTDPFTDIRPCAYRPFDDRITHYNNVVVTWPRTRALGHISTANPALIATRMIKGETPNHFAVVRHPVEKIFISAKTSNNAFAFPLFRNSASALHADEQLNLKCDVLGGTDGLPIGALAYIYGIVHSSEYRRRYSEFLKLDFPRIPRCPRRILFRLVSRAGRDLIALHLLEADYAYASWNQPDATTCNPFATPTTTFHDTGDREVRKAGEKGKQMAPSRDYGEGFGRVYINDTAYFDGVPEAVWNFHIGGYQVCHKWLYDRRRKGGKNPRPGRILTDDDIAHYHKIVIALNETIRIMAEIDEVIEVHGGWPGAFVTEKDEEK